MSKGFRFDVPWIIQGTCELIYAKRKPRSGCRPLEVLARSCCVKWASFFVGFVFSSGLLGDAADFGIGRFLYALSAIVLVIVSSFVLTQVDLVRIVEAREGVQDKQGVEDACRSMAERFGPSVRETEVMVYLANGRTVPYIQDKLTISQSTVKTHVRNIYRKMGGGEGQARASRCDRKRDFLTFLRVLIRFPK